MTNTFKYINEDILQKYGIIGQCPLCNEETRIYQYPNDVKDSDALVDYVDEACASCIRKSSFNYWEENKNRQHIQSIVNNHFNQEQLSVKDKKSKVKKILNEFQKTPMLPNFVQRVDWPHCCGDFTEFIGEPRSKTAGDLDEYLYWDHKPCDNPYNESLYELIPEDKLTVIGGVSGFQCNNCDKTYWTYQHT